MKWMVMMMKMSGMTNTKEVDKLYEDQVKFQTMVLNGQGITLELPADTSRWFEYHCLAMLEEMGEVLKADKRWKTHRNIRYDKDEKLDELADVYITLMNICIHSDVSMDQLLDAVSKKQLRNFRRLSEDEANNR